MSARAAAPKDVHLRTGLHATPARRIDIVRPADRPALAATSPGPDGSLVLDASSAAADLDARRWHELRRSAVPRSMLVWADATSARHLLGIDTVEPPEPALPDLARQLRDAGAEAVVLVPDRAEDAPAYLSSVHAQGWLAGAPVDAPGARATRGRDAVDAAIAALSRGFVAADAAVIGLMSARRARRAGAASTAAFEPHDLPALWDGDEPPSTLAPRPAARPPAPPLDLYAIVDRAERVAAVAAAGIRTLQLRAKAGPGLPPDALRAEVAAAVLAARAAGAWLVVNDHLELALELGAPAVHLGQEDLLALDPAQRERLRREGPVLGISSHSLWELARCAAWAPAYVACGPVWPTLTKAMPWRPQGLDNLAWWTAMAPAPVVAIGGILDPAHVEAAARCGPAGVCIVRGLGDDPAATVPAFAAALARGRAAPREPVPVLPHPSLD